MEEETKAQIISKLEDNQDQINQIKDNTSDLLDIVGLPGLDKDLSDLIVTICKSTGNRINNFEINNVQIRRLLDQTPNQATDNPRPFEKGSASTEPISLRPQTNPPLRQKEKIFHEELPAVEIQQNLMRELYSLPNTDQRYLDFTGIYPRINYLQDISPQEIRKWYDFGAINSIYLTSPDFPEIRLLPHWVQEGVKDYYVNNPTVSTKDILMLKLFSAGPDFHKENRYPAYHYLQIGKAFPNVIQNERKDFNKFDEKDIHYRRAIGIRIVLQAMENTLKRGFRTYSGKKMYSSIMTSPVRRTPDSAARYFQTKIKWIDTGNIASSPHALSKICQFRSHAKGTCEMFSPKKMAQKDSDSDILMTTDSD